MLRWRVYLSKLAVSRLRNTLPPHLVLWGMEPATLDWGLDLTPPVAAALDGLVTAVVQEIERWGTSVLSALPSQPPTASLVPDACRQ